MEGIARKALVVPRPRDRGDVFAHVTLPPPLAEKHIERTRRKLGRGRPVAGAPEPQVGEEVERRPDRAFPVALAGEGGVVARRGREHELTPELPGVEQVLPDEPAGARLGRDPGEERVEEGGGAALRGPPQVGAVVEVVAPLFGPEGVERGAEGARPGFELVRFGRPPEEARELGKRPAVGDIEAGQPDVLKLEDVPLPVEGDVLVHRRVVHPGLVAGGGLRPRHRLGEGVRRLVGSVGEEVAVAAGLRPPAVPGEQRLENRFQEPAFREAPVHLAHHDPAHRRLGPVPGLAAVPPVVVRQEPLGGVAAQVFDDGGERQVATLERGEVAEEEVVPAEERDAAVLLVPETADGGDHPPVAGFVHRVPGEPGSHREPRLREFAEFRGAGFEFLAPGVERPADVGGRLCRLPPAAGEHTGGRAEPHHPVRRQAAGVGVVLVDSRDPDRLLAVRQPGDEPVDVPVEEPVGEPVRRRFHRAGAIPGHPRAHHQFEGGVGGGVGGGLRSHQDHQLAVLVASCLHHRREAPPGDFEPLVGPIGGPDPGTHRLGAFFPPPDERFAEMVLIEERVPLEAEVHREPLGQEHVAQHAAAVPGVPAGGEAPLDRPVLRNVPKARVVLGVAVRPVGCGVLTRGRRGLRRPAPGHGSRPGEPEEKGAQNPSRGPGAARRATGGAGRRDHGGRGSRYSIFQKAMPEACFPTSTTASRSRDSRL